MLSAVDQEEALALQLRGPGGAVIATASIAVTDTDYLLSIARSDLGNDNAVDAEHEGEIEALLEGWGAEAEPLNLQLPSEEETEFPRYQIQVHLVDPDSLP